MNNNRKTAINPTRQEDYSQWYQEVIKSADLAEHALVRGCMVIKPWGYSLWENIQQRLDKLIKATGHHNFYFPMFIPLSLLEKEANHVEGFAKECAVITHHRLESDGKGGLIPAPSSELEEPLVIRPTSEVVIGEAFSRWIHSYRDLPLLGNQWANVVRWEMRTRLFLRTSEFLWQEGHTAHATAEEAIEETEKMLEVYRQVLEDFLAVPVILGCKTVNEKFPGADITYCLEAMMQDGKALQVGTSHFLGQNFAKAFNIKFTSESGSEEFVWTTSWGVTTRLIGSLIMVHSDDDGLVLPPKAAPIQIVIIPLIHKPENEAAIMNYCKDLQFKLKAKSYDGQQLRVDIDNKVKSPGEKVWGWIKKGVPIRLEIGQREVDASNVFMGRRDFSPSEKQSVDFDVFINEADSILDSVQQNIFNKAKKFLEQNMVQANSREELHQLFSGSEDNKSMFVSAYWSGDEATEAVLKSQLKVTARCIPLQAPLGKCIFTGKESSPMTVFARAY